MLSPNKSGVSSRQNRRGLCAKRNSFNLVKWNTQMTHIGTFRSRSQSDQTETLEGQINTLAFSGKLVIKRSSISDHPNAPTHKIYFVRTDAANVEIGAAWMQRIKNGERAGEEFLSAQIDDPSMPHPLSFGLFQEDEDGNWNATWRRRQDKS